MRKNKIMRFASLILVLTLLSTSVISGTFAKYTTTDEASDTARVAKWGVTALVAGSLYGENYFDVDDSNEISASVEFSADSNGAVADIRDIVAPGTQNTTGLKLGISGTPEVKNTVTVTNEKTADATYEYEEIFLKGGNYATLVQTSNVTADNFAEYGDLFTTDDNGATFVKATAYSDTATYYEVHDVVSVNYDYYPVTYTWTPNTGSALVTTDLDTVNSAIATYFNGTNNANITIDKSGVLTWAWAFNDLAARPYADGADTILGNLMAEATDQYIVKYSTGSATALVDGTDYNLTTNFDVTITIDQVD